MVIVAGVPNRAIHPLKKASATVSALLFTSGIASGQRVNRSTQVSTYLKPLRQGSDYIGQIFVLSRTGYINHPIILIRTGRPYPW